MLPNRRTLLAILVASLTAGAAQSAQLLQPEGTVILSVSGNIANGGETVEFDLAMLDALPQRTTTTATPWYEGEQSFSGPVLLDLLNAVGAKGISVTVTALNDYSAEIPMEDLVAAPVILASRLNGETLSVRDKGPLFVIYPFDLDPDLYNEVSFGRSVWQVKSILVH